LYCVLESKQKTLRIPVSMSHRLFEVICVGNLCMYTGISPRGFVNNVLFLALSLYLSLPLSYSCCTSGRRKRIKPRLLELNVNSTFIGLCCWSRCCCCCCCFCWATEEGLRRVHRTKCCVSLQDVPVAIAATTVALSAASIRVHPLPQAPSHERLFLPSPQRQPQQLAAPIVRKPNARLHAGGEEQDRVRRCFDQDPVRVVLGKGG